MNEYELVKERAAESVQKQKEDGWRMYRFQGWKTDDSRLPSNIDTTKADRLALVSVYGTERTHEFAAHIHPTFAFDNAPHIGESWCGMCHEWKANHHFSVDGTRSKNGKVAYRRRCKACRKVEGRESRQRQWKNGYKRGA